jgi:hypothetical protein
MILARHENTRVAHRQEQDPERDPYRPHLKEPEGR